MFFFYILVFTDFLIYFVHSGWREVYAQDMCRNQRTTCGKGFFPSTMCIPGVKLRSFAWSLITHCAILDKAELQPECYLSEMAKGSCAFD